MALVSLTDTPVIIDDAYLELADDEAATDQYDFSDVSTKIEFDIQYGTVDLPPTFGKKARKKVTTKTYTITLNVTFRTNGYAATDLDGIMTAYLPSPEGAGDGNVFLRFRPTSAVVSASNPSKIRYIFFCYVEAYGWWRCRCYC